MFFLSLLPSFRRRTNVSLNSRNPQKSISYADRHMDPVRANFALRQNANGMTLFFNERMPVFCCEENRTKPHLIQVSGQELKCSYVSIQLSSDTYITNEVIVGCYELRVVICNYQNYPVTAGSRTPQRAFTTRVDPVSGPPESASAKRLKIPSAAPKLQSNAGGLSPPNTRFRFFQKLQRGTHNL